jgi:hypothetical protein
MRLADHRGCSYTSPPQSAEAALELVRVLGGCTQRRGAAVAHGDRRRRRTITLAAAHPDGQLVMGDR